MGYAAIVVSFGSSAMNVVMVGVFHINLVKTIYGRQVFIQLGCLFPLLFCIWQCGTKAKCRPTGGFSSEGGGGRCVA